MDGGNVLKFLASLLTEGEHDGGFTVDRPSEILLVDGELLVSINGTDYAIKAEAF